MYILITIILMKHVVSQLPWVKSQIFNRGLPASVQIYTLNTTRSPWGTKLTGAFAKFNMKDLALEFKVLSTDPGIKKTPMQFAAQQSNVVYAVINGGYFDMTNNISQNFICENSKVKAKNSINIAPNHFPTTGAFGYHSGLFSAQYIYSFGADYLTYKFNQPNPVPGPAPTPSQGTLWAVSEAIGAGPILVKAGIGIQDNPQNFNSDSMLNTRHPRSAICVDNQDNLIFLAMDGRYDGSDGLYMSQIRQVMQQLNCIDAMNLDGGGSTLLFANNQIINRPSDPVPRPIVSAVMIRDRSKRKILQQNQ